MGRKVWFLLMVTLLVATGYTIGYTLQVISPTIAAVAELKVKSLMTRGVNEAVRERFAEDLDAEELFRITENADGKISMVQTDTVAMNRLISELADRIQGRMAAMKSESVEIPVGAVLGSSILSQIGPSLHIRIIPIGMAKVDYQSEFVNAGVNQTCHRIYLQVESTVQLLAPFSKEDVELSTKILIAETIIVGDVPQSYIIVPDENILDALD